MTNKSAARRLAEEMADEICLYIDQWLAGTQKANVAINVYTRNQIANKIEAKLGSWASGHQAAEDEREACARIAEGYAQLHIESNPCHIQAKKTAAKIRARKEVK